MLHDNKNNVLLSKDLIKKLVIIVALGMILFAVRTGRYASASLGRGL